MNELETWPARAAARRGGSRADDRATACSSTRSPRRRCRLPTSRSRSIVRSPHRRATSSRSWARCRGAGRAVHPGRLRAGAVAGRRRAVGPRARAAGRAPRAPGARARRVARPPGHGRGGFTAGARRARASPRCCASACSATRCARRAAASPAMRRWSRTRRRAGRRRGADRDRAGRTARRVRRRRGARRAPSEFREARSLRPLLDLIDRSEPWRDLVHGEAPGLAVTIGREHGRPEWAHLSLVSFRLPGPGDASIGLLGPRRMDYARVMGLVDYAGRRLPSWF